MFLQEYTGRGVRVAVVDSGVHATHPHVGAVEEGITVREDGSLDEDFVDRLGHGTAVTAVIREESPDAGIIIVKVFWGRLTTDITSLVRGIDEAALRLAVAMKQVVDRVEVPGRVVDDACGRRKSEASQDEADLY